MALAAIAMAVALDGSVVKPYNNLWKVTIRSKKRTAAVGTWSDDVKPATVHGKPAYVRVQVFKIKNGDTNTMITAFDRTTMRPFSSAFMTSFGDATLRRFENGNVVIDDASGSNRGIPVQQRVRVKENAYDFNAGMYGILLVGLPLRAGLTGVIPTYGQTDATIEHVHYAVRGKQDVEAKPGTHVQAWVLDAYYLDAHRPEADAQMRFWLTTTPPYIIKLIYDLPKENQTWTYTMI